MNPASENTEKKLIVVGGGLAGSEAAWQAAERGVDVTLYEMRPHKLTPAHETGQLAELVCSNSLGSLKAISAPGLLKEEMRRLGSLIIRTAEACAVPAGGALAVDRDRFAKNISGCIKKHPRITVLHEEVKEIPPDGTIAVVSSGPLTSEALTESLKAAAQTEHLYFYDAISPILEADGIDMEIVFRASRYGKGGDDYLNCPMNEAEYDRFYEALMAGERVEAKSFEKIKYFEGCLPIEVLAERGKKTPLFGPMKPVGLVDPRTGEQPFAVVQLRAENRFGTAYSLVGFQTKMTWPEQRRIFKMIPGLENANFLRLGSLHRNTFLNSPRILSESLQLRTQPGLFLAGQIVGVEGYVESASMGYLAGMNAARLLSGKTTAVPPENTAHGALIQYITKSNPTFFQPINSNFGLFPPVAPMIKGRYKMKKTERYQKIVERALDELSLWITQYGILNDISK
ncbi:Methylenetetrahydrofolate--tRNA-(uracil-5-)-methyltransferase TrmFO [hydrothermal vent metagenome]|uniref:Methylenetetrahydrofolate--tRNA-(Uracil-5-)-methyltransferase TrmFO n=1 Tax=hydrothermal vent metagenome TaxID=652676 RepID=A0A3B1DN23_9ZZZZ